MAIPSLDRRRLLKIGGGLWASALLPAALPGIARAAADNRSVGNYTALSPALAATLDAVAARIIPTTDTPGAREAGAVWFMDAAFAGTLSGSRDANLAGALPLVEAGVADLDERAGGRFADLPGERQDALLRDIEDGEFFGLVHFLTLAGTLTMPRYGGNRGEVAWDLLGLERRHRWEAPYGYYDAAVHGAGSGGSPGSEPAANAHVPAAGPTHAAGAHSDRKSGPTGAPARGDAR